MICSYIPLLFHFAESSSVFENFYKYKLLLCVFAKGFSVDILQKKHVSSKIMIDCQEARSASGRKSKGNLRKMVHLFERQQKVRMQSSELK